MIPSGKQENTSCDAVDDAAFTQRSTDAPGFRIESGGGNQNRQIFAPLNLQRAAGTDRSSVQRYFGRRRFHHHRKRLRFGRNKRAPRSETAAHCRQAE